MAICSTLLNTGACGDTHCTSNHDVHMCHICSIVCISTRTYSAHLGGKRHQQKLNGGTVVCNICQVSVTRRTWFEHLVDSSHLRAADLQATGPNIDPEEQDTPPNFRHCDLCNCDVPESCWRSHVEGGRHCKKEKFYAFKSVVQEAEKDKNGVTVSHQDGIDFGIVELLDAQRGVGMTLVLKTTVPISRIRVLDLKLSSVSSRRRQASHFTVEMVGTSQNLVFGREMNVRVKFAPPYRGRYEDRLEVLLEDTQLDRTFIIIRQIRAIVGDRADHALLKPVAPYVPQKRTNRQAEKEVVPGVRPESTQAIPWVVPLPQANIPSHLDSSLRYGSVSDRVVRMKKTFLPQTLDSKTYGRHFNHLLWIEEFQMDRDLERYDIPNAELIKYNQYYYLTVPGLAEKRPSVLQGDRILVQPHGTAPGKWFEGFVHVVRREDVGLCFNQSFNGHTPRQKYNIHFKLNRYPARRQHQAMDTVFQNDRVLFPTVDHLAGLVRPRSLTSGRDFYNQHITTNAAQAQAVTSIVNLAHGAPPFCVFGPPGTGKTVTIVEAIRQILRKDRNARILACAPSNSAADLIAERIMDGTSPDQLFRFYAPSRHRNQVPDRLQQYTYEKNGHFSVPPMSRMTRFQVIVSTCVSASVFHGIGMPRGHFSYIFVDEAGQATEPEVMISVKTMADNLTRVVLSGDHRQLGPIIRSDVARTLGLEVSYLERLMKRGAYDEKLKHGVSVVKLIENFRSHESILSFPNGKFYDGDLKACGDRRVTDSFLGSRILVNKRFPIVFHGISGKDDREAMSPSFFNIDEILEVRAYVTMLKEKLHITDHDIGIITPYHAQVLKIRASLRAVADEIKVGSVEEFQGQERKVIIMSTVRSSAEFIDYDVKHTLGFVASPRRFNVAVTRAKALLVVIGNPSVLSLDPLWRSFLNYVYKNRGWTGCEISWDPEAAVDENGRYDKEFREMGVKDMNEFTRRMQMVTLESAVADDASDDEGANVDRPWRDIE